MSILKKVLALVLVVALMMGFATVAGAADFTDSADVDHTEAVEVMTAIGVINGYPDGSFRPDGNVTRAQMAKMVAYIVSGGEDVGDLYAGATTFSDCLTHWARGYIAYANTTGIIAGVGNGRFNPDGNVTGVQAAKMMLCALGYDQDVEGYTGTGWNVNVLSDARTAGLLKGLSGVNMNAALSREDAAQLMLNALQADMVEYSSGNVTVSGGDGTTVTIAGSDASKIETSDAEYKAADNDGYLQLCEEYFPDLKLREGTEDSMGRPSVRWTYKSSTVGTYSATADYTVYIASGDDIADTIDDIDDDFDDATADVYINGADAALTNGATGDYVEVYMDDDNADRVDVIAVTHKSVAKLTGDPDTRESGDDTLVRVPGVGTLTSFRSSNTTETVNGYEGLQEDDIVLYYQDKDGNWYLELADSFTGTLTAVSGTSYTISGTRYDASGVDNVLDGGSITVNSFYSDAATWYTDNAGNIVWVEGDEATELAYVFAVKAPSTGWTGSAPTNDAQAMLLLPDNTVITVTYEAASGSSITEDMFVRYSVDSDDVYTLEAVGAYAASPAAAGYVATSNSQYFATEKGNPNIMLSGANSTFAGDKLTDSGTVFFIRDYDSSSNQVKNTYTMYTGYANVPTIDATEVTTGTGGSGNHKSAVAYIGADGYADYVVIDTVSNVSGISTASDMFYVVDNTVTTLYDADGIVGYTVEAIKNDGSDEIVDLAFAISPSVAAGSAYIASGYNTDGQITSFGDAATSQAPNTAITNGQDVYVVGSNIGASSNGTIRLAGTAYGYTDDTVVYYVDSDGELSVMTVGELDEDADDTFVAVRGSATNTDDTYNTIVALFVTQVRTNVTSGSLAGFFIDGSGSAATGSQTTTVGSHTIKVTASGQAATATISYAWTVNGSAVGSNSDTLTYNFGTAGQYTVDCIATVTDLTMDGTQTYVHNMPDLTLTVNAVGT